MLLSRCGYAHENAVHVHDVRRGCQICRIAGSCEPSGVVLGTELESFARAAALLTAETFIQCTCVCAHIHTLFTKTQSHFAA